MNASLLGIYLKLASLVLFCTMDAMVKALGGTYGAFQLMLFRSAVALLPIAIIVWRSGHLSSVHSKRPWLQVARIIAGLGSTIGFFYVFPRMPLVDAYAISFAAPFFMVALSVPLLGEQVGWRRWTAVGVGFVGVLLMLDPWGIEFHAMSLIVLGATFCYSLSTILVRLTSRYDQDAATLFWFAAVSSLVSLAGAIPEWIWPTPIDWMWLILLGLLGGVAQVMVTRAWRLAPAAVLAPFDYTSIVLAVLFGYFWFREETSWMVWVGLPLVIGSGLYILHRERVRARERRH
ncbi:MAG: DMT family transporter [Alphaproteobacteria bacterium]|nr:DMT family transporter [Alphaproteobacteria bacterium]